MSAPDGAGGVLAPGRDSLPHAGLQNSPAPPPAQPQTQPQQGAQSMQLSFGSNSPAVYNPASGSSQQYQTSGPGSGSFDPSSGSGAGALVPFQQPKKRGRPRKYSNLGMSPGSAGFSSPPSGSTFSPTQQALPPSQGASNSGGLASPPPGKKRGRPPGSGTGSGKKQHRQHQEQQQQQQQQLDALGSAGYGFTPHIIHVNIGEDLSSKIMSFSQQGPRDICVLSASGSISNVTLRQAATSGGTATYEGRFDILSLSGSFLLTEVGGQRTRTGGLSIALTGPDGRVLGGSVAGLLTAASPVQILVGSFIANGQKEPKQANNLNPYAAPARVISGGATGASSPPSHGTQSESSGGPGSPPNMAAASNGQGIASIPWK